MSDKRIFEIKLAEWFPPNDPLAMQMARLCVLREYYMLEMRGLTSNDLRELDAHSDAWRRLYFLFNSVRTLWEIQGAITVICGDAEFKKIRANREAKEEAELKELVSRLNAAIPELRTLRDSLGGHILRQALQAALNAMDTARTGEPEIGRTKADTHYKFARQLVLEVMLTGVPERSEGMSTESTLECFPVCCLSSKALKHLSFGMRSIVVWFQGDVLSAGAARFRPSFLSPPRATLNSCPEIPFLEACGT